MQACRQHEEKRMIVCYSLLTAHIAGVVKVSMVTDIEEYQRVFSPKFVPRASKFVKVRAVKIADEEGMESTSYNVGFVHPLHDQQHALD